MLRRRAVLLILFMISVLSLGSFISVLLYLDPYTYKVLGILLLIISFFGSVGGVITLCIYFVKKIYYRGEVGMYHILTSLRQGFLITLFFAGSIYISGLGISEFLPIILLLVSLIFLELFIQNL